MLRAGAGINCMGVHARGAGVEGRGLALRHLLHQAVHLARAGLHAGRTAVRGAVIARAQGRRRGAPGRSGRFFRGLRAGCSPAGSACPARPLPPCPCAGGARLSFDRHPAAGPIQHNASRAGGMRRGTHLGMTNDTATWLCAARLYTSSGRVSRMSIARAPASLMSPAHTKATQRNAVRRVSRCRRTRQSARRRFGRRRRKMVLAAMHRGWASGRRQDSP